MFKSEDRSLRKVEVEEESAESGNYWAVAWGKLEIVPHRSGRALVGHLCIEGREVVPIMAVLGYTERSVVVRELSRQLELPEEFVSEFIGCTLERIDITTGVEQDLSAHAGENESPS